MSSERPDRSRSYADLLGGHAIEGTGYLDSGPTDLGLFGGKLARRQRFRRAVAHRCGGSSVPRSACLTSE